MAYCNRDWSGKRDSNSRPRPWQGRALPTELFPHNRRLSLRCGVNGLDAAEILDSDALLFTARSGAGNETRTRDPDLGKVVLYQLSYSRIIVFQSAAALTALAQLNYLIQNICYFYSSVPVVNSSPVRGAHYTRNPSRRKRCKAKFCALRAFAVLIGKLLLSCAPALIYSCRKCSR